MVSKKHILLIVLFVFLTFSLRGEDAFFKKLSDAAIELTKEKAVYDPSYYKIPYPNGDIPAGKGVCTDVIIRAYRKLDIDLQKEVHEDMQNNFRKYPQKWGRKKADSNIDHRRVPNLMTFFSRYGVVKPNSYKTSDYNTGDIVCWDLGKGVTHIGIVIERMQNGIPLIVHNIGHGQETSNCLFEYKIIGHYRYKK